MSRPGSSAAGWNRPLGRKILRAAYLFGALVVTGGVGVGQAVASEADEISYTYVTLEYEYSNVYNGSRGLTEGFSFEVADPIHIFGGIQQTALDIGLGVNGDRNGYLIGAGIKQRIGRGKTMQYRAGYISSQTDINIYGLDMPIVVDDEGRYLEVGIRTLPWPKWELDGFVANFEVGEFNSTMLFVTLERRVTENLGINLSFRNVWGDNASQNWILAARYHFCMRPISFGACR